MKNYLFLLFTCLLIVSCRDTIYLKNLTIEHRKSGTLGLDELHPRFGWQIHADENDVMQQSYRILVASSRKNAEQKVGDIWDSGMVESDASQWIEYGGKGLLPNSPYYWCVQVVTNKGTSDWSEVTSWSTGLLDESNWKGQWIGLDSLVVGEDEMTRHSRLRIRYLRKEFGTTKKVERAIVHVSGLGYYVMYLNGQRMPNNYLSPAPTDYTKSVIYDTYDVTDMIQKNNVIGVVLGPGYYYAMAQNFEANVRTTYGFPRLLMNLIVEYEDGTKETIVTDDSWKLTNDGAIRYANLYDGMLYDARKELKGWLDKEYDDNAWLDACVVSAPGGKLVGNLLPPVVPYEKNYPETIKRFGNRFIVDFGTNNAGRIMLSNVNLVEGDTLRIRYSELLQEGDSLLYVANLRSSQNTDYFIGDGSEHDFTTEFIWHGFRYAELMGVQSLDAEDLVRENLADDLTTTSRIVVHDADGNNMLNRILDNAYRGIMSNYKGIPMDCPQRDERMPWLGDRTTGCWGESFLTDNYSLYAKWIKDICECQLPDGRISDVAPAYWRLYNTNITWPAALPFACDMMYRQYGDIRPMKNSYLSVHRWLANIRKKSYADGLLTYDRYGDWCVPPESLDLIHSKDPERVTNGQLLSSCYYYYICRMMTHYAPLTGNDSLAAYYKSEADITLQAVNDKFLKGYTYDNSTVTANLLPLAMGMTPDSIARNVHESLISTIVSKNNSHISCGVIGIQWIMRYLSENGCGDLAYQIASTDTYPSWGYMVKNGATTIWELWNGNTANPAMNSGNHVMLLGDLLPWCYEHLAGISSDKARNGFKHIVLAPDFSIEKITSVEACYPSIYGEVISCWKKKDEKVEWRIVIPANTTAEIVLPDSTQMLTSGEHLITFPLNDN